MLPGMAFLRGDGKAILSRAIVAFEAETAAELVVVVEPRVGHYAHIAVAAGALAAFAALAFLLYGEPSFALHWFLIDPVLIGAFVGYLSGGWAPLERALSRHSKREAWALRSARAAFVARGVADTTGRTGVLLHVAVVERIATVIADSGVRRAIPEAAWTQACAPLIAAVARGEPATAVAPHIAALGALCGVHLPRQADDINELSDEVDS
jgi:putative membrane protein